jgi:hypothetical protein
MSTARKMADWGDAVVGFEQRHDQAGGMTVNANVRLYLAGDNVEVQFGSTVHYAGGVQHSADGSLVLTREDARNLAAALADSDRRERAVEAEAVANAGCNGCEGACGTCALDCLRRLREHDPRELVIEMLCTMPDPESPSAIPWMRAVKRMAQQLENES